MNGGNIPRAGGPRVLESNRRGRTEPRQSDAVDGVGDPSVDAFTRTGVAVGEAEVEVGDPAPGSSPVCDFASGSYDGGETSTSPGPVSCQPNRIGAGSTPPLSPDAETVYSTCSAVTSPASETVAVAP